MHRPLAVAAVVLLAAGLLVGGLPTAGFERVSADRQVDVNVADEGNAYLAVSDEYSGGTVRTGFFCFNPSNCFFPEQTQTVVDLENRFTGDYSTINVAVEDVENGPDEALEVRNVPARLTPGSFSGISLGCTAAVRADNQGDVSISISISGSAIDINTRTVVRDVRYNCRQIG